MDTCRICYIQAEKNNPLVAPCVCKGSVQYIHKQCLYRWVRISTRNDCELCKTPFTMEMIKFEQIYRPNQYILQLSTRPFLLLIELICFYILYLQFMQHIVFPVKEASYEKYQYIYDLISNVQQKIPTILGIVLASQSIVLVPAFYMVQRKCRYLSYIVFNRDISGLTATPLSYYMVIACSIFMSFYFRIGGAFSSVIFMSKLYEIHCKLVLQINTDLILEE